MEGRQIPGHSPLEPVVGYSRAVVAGGHVYVAGTAPIPREGDSPAGAYEQPSAMPVVNELLDPRWRVEIDVDAVLAS